MPANTAPPQTAEVVCPLKNTDGTHCRKRCVGDKRYRSMIEHVRRVHSEHYIPKLPAILPAANAAEVLAQLHHQPPSISWEQDHVCLTCVYLR